MSDRIWARVAEAVTAETLTRDVTGRVRVRPPDTAGIAAAMALASREGWRVRVEGRGGWEHPDSPADLVISTAALDRVVRIAPGDLMATLQAGAPLGVVQRALAAEGVWLAWDPPGRGERSVGSIIATGTAGPLRHRYGPIRDHLLGCTIVTGDGRVVTPGGSVVKNVAGFDLTRLMAGSFGTLGVVTEVHVRLRALPAADRTLLAHGPRDTLTRTARELGEQGLEAVAIELFSPALAASTDWTLAVRLAGTAPGVEAEAARLGTLAPASWSVLTPEQASAFWTGASHGALAGPVTLRLGVLVDGLDDLLDLLEVHLDLGVVSAGAGSGAVRWTGPASAAQVRTLRAATATREVPLTLERAPWVLQQETGRFGAYREGVGALVARVQDTFDPRGTLR